ncbi:MAG: hypothetical protein GWN32_20655 [Gemmatimonadetes bacterium]|nr:hypothetical protein [Gemmatimonadota bacterium]
MGIRSDTLFLENVTAAAGETRIPLVSIANLEVKREPMARVGAVFGVLTGGVIGAAAAGELADDASSLIRNLAVVGGATIGGLGGYWAGSTIHKAIAGPRWVEVPVGRLQVGVGRLPRLGVGLRVGYSF